jgi:hypothetical protein
MDTPPNSKPSLFLSHKHRVADIQEALQGAANHLLSGSLNEQMVGAFSGNFGPEPFITFQIVIRRDAKSPGHFVYSSHTKVSHDVGAPVKFFGLKA